MNIEDVRNYCLQKEGVTEGFPFDEETLVFKVLDKIFCLSNFELPLKINLKCNPEKAIELREQYDAVTPGYHMNKKHWNTIEIDNSIPEREIFKLIDHSYSLVVSKLTKAQREKLVSL
jgi:predicted DNA-binding protein (MmcQ/YjbR family)